MKDILLGGNTAGELLAYMILGIVGMVFHILNHVNKGIKNNPDSPGKFSLKYFVFNNLPRLGKTIILVYIASFSGSRIVDIPVVKDFVADWPIFQLVYLSIGYYLDRIVARLESFKKSEDDNKTDQPTKPNR